MGIWQIVAALVIVAGLLVMNIVLHRRVSELEDLCDRRDEALRTAATHLAVNAEKQAELMEKLNERLQTAEEKLEAAEEKLEQLPVEDFTEEVRRMQDFNDGAQSIAMFGGGIPKLNKDAVKR